MMPALVMRLPIPPLLYVCVVINLIPYPVAAPSQRTSRKVKAARNCNAQGTKLTVVLGPAPVHCSGAPAVEPGVDVGFGGTYVADIFSVVVLLPETITTPEPPGASEIVSPSVVMTPPGVNVSEPMTI
jgi:hypothetical protein